MCCGRNNKKKKKSSSSRLNLIKNGLIKGKIKMNLDNVKQEIAGNENVPSDPIHSEDGKWYFWDEIWANRLGPYDTELQARDALWKYIKEELGQ